MSFFREGVSFWKTIVICSNSACLAFPRNTYPSSVVEFGGGLVSYSGADLVLKAKLYGKLHYFQENFVALLVLVHIANMFILERLFKCLEYFRIFLPILLDTIKHHIVGESFTWVVSEVANNVLRYSPQSLDINLFVDFLNKIVSKLVIYQALGVEG